MSKLTYEELEARCASLAADNENALTVLKEANQAVLRAKASFEGMAAENAQMLRLLTDISENHDEYVNQDEYLYAGVPMDYVSEINAYVSRDVEAENPFKETDAFLDEVRAQGVEMFSQKFGGGTLISDMVKETAKEFAAQLRQEAAQ